VKVATCTPRASAAVLVLGLTLAGCGPKDGDSGDTGDTADTSDTSDTTDTTDTTDTEDTDTGKQSDYGVAAVELPDGTPTGSKVGR
jgi:hypothetical protein